MNDTANIVRRKKQNTSVESTASSKSIKCPILQDISHFDVAGRVETRANFLSHPRNTPIRILQGDCREVLRTIDSDSVDLIFTSPPYADNRRKTYGGIPPDEYADWFLPIGEELLRVLKPTGTFVLNIKEKVVHGERHTYVIDLIKALRTQGFLFTEEWCWHKKNSVPGKWPNRFRDAWERLLQFNQSRRFNMYQDAVMVPRGDWADVRLKNMGETDRQRRHSKVGSGFGSNMSHWVNRDRVYPSNVLHIATECKNRRHSAVFPEALPEFFVKLLTQEGDLVLDPFLGSGTTGVVCRRLNRRFCGIELLPEYVELAMERIGLVNRPKTARRFLKSKILMEAVDD